MSEWPGWPDEWFPGTPLWAMSVVNQACARAGVGLYKWAVPLEAIGRYESNWNPAANLCDPDKTLPVGAFQLARGMYRAAREAGFIDEIRIADPEQSAYVAILYINSLLPGYGGYGGIGTLGSKKGLLSRDDRGPRGVLLRWVENPDTFDVEAARELYRGY